MMSLNNLLQRIWRYVRHFKIMMLLDLVTGL
jgi:hypothetical protein